jgi:hypothetical protein
MSEQEKRGPGRPATGETPRFKIGCPRPLWNAMIAAAEPAGGLSAVTRAFYAWYTRQPGAALPARPEVPR